VASRIRYGIPDVLHRERARYAGKRVLVAGSGHSAFNALADLVTLAREEPGTEITWVIRRSDTRQIYGGGAADELPERGSLGTRIAGEVAGGNIRIVTGFRVARIEENSAGVVVASQATALPPVDEIIATTGFRPDLAMLSELRLDLDPAVESPTALAPLIDPNIHSCGAVRPHGFAELSHPERDFFIVGMKSYGRAPTFLMLTGYEQVRSVVAALTGDLESARDVRLVLPETGVCTRELATDTTRELVSVGRSCSG
ncbi:MAG: flavoprotein, partial [Vicinamibacterales bacterium]